MKTAHEHFLDLGPKLAKMAIAACVQSLGKNALTRKISTTAGSINGAIRWSRTEENSQFWNGVYEALRGSPASGPSNYGGVSGYNLGLEAKRRIDQFKQ